ncbi:MAG TPA: ribonuclease HII, partial [Candidatus Nanoarchaeia archaeon]|nr:ribonuclease HII [Candidatus Nanoarchaeia archaeon]
YTIVGAGSIMAKHERDEAISALEASLKTVIGLGYPGDERTIAFARKALKNKDWLIHVRHSWETFQRLKGEQEQMKLGDY